MPTAEAGPRRVELAGASSAQASFASPNFARASRRWAWVGLAVVLAAALGLRLWGVGSGLPYVYNVDEAGHFVPKAVAMFPGSLDPHYFVNPPALTYVLHVVFAVWLGGSRGVVGEYARHPASVFLVARVTVALLGVLAVWLLYLAGARLFDRRVALLAAALEAVAFLPVFYGHFALNDAPTLAPLTLSLLGSALVYRRGRSRDHLLAGAGLGLACASKFTAGIALLPLLAAAGAHHLDSPPRTRPSGPRASRRSAAARLALAFAAALAAFLIANPYALLDFQAFRSDLLHQSSLSGEGQGKLGAPGESGILYYLWSLTWGLGWAPALAALGGALAIWRRHARLGWLLVPTPLLFLAFMGLEGRHFGRWLLPILPILCLLAAFFALQTARLAGARLPRPARPAPPALAVLALLAQGLLYSVHSDLVLSLRDTRGETRSWMLAHVPRGARIVLEPVVPGEWLQEGGPGPPGAHRARWLKYPDLGALVSASGALVPGAPRAVRVEEYELTLTPALIGRYERDGYCWVVTGSTQSGRALADPRRAPWALAYYRALAAHARVVYRASPYAPGSAPAGFSFDWSFDYYPLSYAHPGPEMTVYRLTGGRCRAHAPA